VLVVDDYGIIRPRSRDPRGGELVPRQAIVVLFQPHRSRALTI